MSVILVLRYSRVAESEAFQPRARQLDDNFHSLFWRNARDPACALLNSLAQHQGIIGRAARALDARADGTSRHKALDMKTHVLRSCSVTLLVFAFPAHASDFRGFLSGVVTCAFGLPIAALSLLLFVGLALSGAYRSKATAVWQTRVASVAPMPGLIATFIDSFTIDDEGFPYIVNGAMLALAQLPIVFHRLRQQE